MSANSGIPMWKNIIEKIKRKIDISNNESDYLKIAQYYLILEIKKNIMTF